MPDTEIPHPIRELLEDLHPGFWRKSPSAVVAAAQLILDLEAAVSDGGLGFTVAVTPVANGNFVALTPRAAGHRVFEAEGPTLAVALFQAVIAAMKDEQCRSSFPNTMDKPREGGEASSAAPVQRQDKPSERANATNPGLQLIVQRLDSNQERLLTGWMDAVRNDGSIPSADRLTLANLRDDFPEMLRELIEYLRQGDVTPDSAETRTTGMAHGSGRWKQGYRLDEVLHELARVREMLLEEIESYSEPEITPKTRSTVNLTIRRFFDNIAAVSARQFVRAQEGELVLRSRQLEQAYEQVHAATEELRSVAESRLSLLRAVNHELRNALQPVAYAAHALSMEADDQRQSEIRVRLEHVAHRLESLLDRLGSLSAVLSGQSRANLSPVRLDDIVHGLKKEFAGQIESKGLRFECAVPSKSFELTSDVGKLHEIGGILLSNAMNNTPSGYIRLEALVSADEDHWTLRVTDSGVGINAQLARNLFQEFRSRDTITGEGLHLGLVLGRYLARLLGGDITFQSAPGNGSSFELNMPRVSPASGG